MEWTTEMREVAYGLMEHVVSGEGCEEACARCPFADRCEACEGWWGCPCWEEGMGEDL